MEKVDRAVRVQRGPFLITILSYSNEICKIQSLTNCFKKKIWLRKGNRNLKILFEPENPSIFPRVGNHKFEQISNF